VSSRKKSDGGQFVTAQDCRERHVPVTLALFGKDGRGGIVDDVRIIKVGMQNVEKWIQNQENDKKQSRRDWKDVGLKLLVGAILALVSYWLGTGAHV